MTLSGTPQAGARADDLAFLKSVDILGGFTRGQFLSLLDQQTRVHLEKDEALFDTGDPGGDIFILKHGTLKAFVKGADGRPQEVATIRPGQTVGEMQILFDAPRTATVRADTAADLLKFSRDGFRDCARSSTGTMEKIVDIIRHRLQRDQLAALLPEIFGPLDEEIIRRVESMLRWVTLPKGRPLFLQGDRPDNVYLVVNGVLHAYCGTPEAPRQCFIRSMGRGECIGEMGVIAGENRSASVYAARDSLLACFSSRVFDDILTTYPSVSRFITRTLIRRLQQRGDSASAGATVQRIAVVPAGKPFPLSDFTARLARRLAGSGRVLHLSSREVDRRLGATDISQVAPDTPHNMHLATWLEEQEARNRFILFEADDWASSWTRRALSHADKILLVGQDGEDPALGSIEAAFIFGNAPVTDVPPMLVMQHRGPDIAPSGTRHWLCHRTVETHLHIRAGHDGDMGRLVRFLTGRAVGLVLGGGGARGLTHIGVLRAIEEAGIPVDMVGGTSMGAIVGAHYAMGWGIDAIMADQRDTLANAGFLKDYTLPVYSILRGRRLNQVLKKTFGEQRIEDLSRGYFCVSSNMTQVCLAVHRQGLVWKAVRASGSLPGIFEPWVHGEDIHVDGGLFNNLPGDVMRQLIHGYVILSDASELGPVAFPGARPPSPWWVAYQKLVPWRHPQDLPTVLDILLRSTTLSSVQKKVQVKADADLYLCPPIDRYGMLEFSAIDAIVEAGYRHTCEKLEALEKAGGMPARD